MGKEKKPGTTKEIFSSSSSDSVDDILRDLFDDSLEIDEMLNKQIDTMAKFLEKMEKDKRLIPAIAKLSKKIYEELIKAGFTKEEALHITASHAHSIATNK